MSLLPRCDRCGGLEVVNGPMGRSMESRCKCGEGEPNALRGDILDLEAKPLGGGRYRVAV
jgi:hypothetical protein